MMSGRTESSVQQLEANFELLEDWEQRFAYLIDLGRKLPPLDEADKTPENRVPGCQATVYMAARSSAEEPRVMELSAISDAHIVNGLIAILLDLYNGKSPRQVLELDAAGLFKRLELEEHLSPTRRNGLHSMLQRIHALAREMLQ